MVQCVASPAFTVNSTAFSLMVGNAPGIPVHTSQQWVLGAPPNWFLQLQKTLVWVASSTCVSKPITISYSIILPPFHKILRVAKVFVLQNSCQ